MSDAKIINLLTGIRSMQTDPACLNNENLMEQLEEMKLTAVELFELQGTMDHITIEGYKKDALGQMKQLHELISACSNGVHDRALLDIGLAADNLAKRIYHVLELRHENEMKRSVGEITRGAA